MRVITLKYFIEFFKIIEFFFRGLHEKAPMKIQLEIDQRAIKRMAKRNRCKVVEAEASFEAWMKRRVLEFRWRYCRGHRPK